MANEKTARAVLVGGLRFDATTGTGHHVMMNTHEVGSDEEVGPTPMELVLVGLAGCTGMDVISILSKMRQDVTGYEVRVSGIQQEEHPRVYTEITVEHVVTGRDLNSDLVQRAVDLSATRYCPVGAMLGRAATITHVVRLVAAPGIES